jgi:N-acetylmuramoyl-L-alanine amidase
MCVEVLFVTQSALAGEMSAAIVDAADLIDRGAKKRTDLFFLNNTEMPSILIETCFVDSTADASLYQQQFGMICEAIAAVLGGAEEVKPPDETDPPVRPVKPPPTLRLDVEVTGEVTIIINGVPVT